jgi:hypothetical protein
LAIWIKTAKAQSTPNTVTGESFKHEDVPTAGRFWVGNRVHLKIEELSILDEWNVLIPSRIAFQKKNVRISIVDLRRDETFTLDCNPALNFKRPGRYRLADGQD